MFARPERRHDHGAARPRAQVPRLFILLVSGATANANITGTASFVAPSVCAAGLQLNV
jgi:hypothetical protein